MSLFAFPPVRRRTWLVAALLPLLAAGCRSLNIEIPSYSVPGAPPGGGFAAGVGESDLTPPPGIPMGGHSIAGWVARGHWTRLHARAFFFRDGKGGTAALVSCELFAIPAGLRAKVAERAATRGVPIAPEGLLLAATHTHHGPGNYMSSKLYNGFASLWPGFHQPLFDFLAERITDAVVMAAEDARENGTRRHSVALHASALPELLRNRAIDAFFRNPEAAGLLLPPACPTPCDLAAVRYRAVDPTLTVLELLRERNGAPKRIGLLVFLAVHSTALSHENPLYASDFTGWAMTRLQRAAEGGGSPVVAGFFNGAEGDVSPRWLRQDRTDAERLGALLADAVERTLESPARSDGEPTVEALSEAFQVNPPGPEAQGLAPTPEFGIGSVGGAEDGRTALEHFGWHSGVRGAPRAGQGVKVPALDLPTIPLLKALKLTHLLAPASDFPSDLPVSILRLGPLSIGTIPVEMTTAMGRRLRDSLQKLEAPRTFVLVGLANEYLSYVTTPEEYDAQEYEGASTMFGPRTGPVIVRFLEILAGRKPQRPATVSAVRFRAGPPPLMPFGPAMPGLRRDSFDEGLETLMPDASGRLAARSPRFEWEEEAADDWQATSRRITILEETSSGFSPRRDAMGIDDDRGVRFLTVLADGTLSRRRRWGAIWLFPNEATLDSRRRHLFRVEPVKGAPVCSAPFSLAALPATSPPPPIQKGACP
ncbi:MAG: neutral/alkaline non-lysosomal ceramidase N-terminal domain-containing protein [Thermoanaerobaculia bacterium]|nr:neutral/alkaline non-lysosomal ceramidase N-terminal domain-containing protein [Thermoanaerobaculia bacterium]